MTKKALSRANLHKLVIIKTKVKGLPTLTSQKVMSITLISCWDLKQSKSNKRALSEAKHHAKLENEPQQGASCEAKVELAAKLKEAHK